MSKLVFLIIGLLLGGIIGVTMMCLFQINRINNTKSITKEIEHNEKKNN